MKDPHIKKCFLHTSTPETPYTNVQSSFLRPVCRIQETLVSDWLKFGLSLNITKHFSHHTGSKVSQLVMSKRQVSSLTASHHMFWLEFFSHMYTVSSNAQVAIHSARQWHREKLLYGGRIHVVLTVALLAMQTHLFHWLQGHFSACLLANRISMIVQNQPVLSYIYFFAHFSNVVA